MATAIRAVATMDWGRRFVEALELLGATDLDCELGLSACHRGRGQPGQVRRGGFRRRRRQGARAVLVRTGFSQSRAEFSSHSASPGQVVGLAREMFRAQVKAYALGIRGYHFGELSESLSEQGS